MSEVMVKIPRLMSLHDTARTFTTYLIGPLAFDAGQNRGPFAKNGSDAYDYQLDCSNDYWLNSSSPFKEATLSCRYAGQHERIKRMAELFEITYGDHEWKPKS